MQDERTFKTNLKRPFSLNYLLHLPPGYKTSKQRRPLMLFLHGVGESGTRLSKVADHGPPKLADKTPRGRNAEAIRLLQKNFIVASPQCAVGVGWNAAALSALLDGLEKKLRVDNGRIYLTGLSMGGYGTWELGLREPNRFAALAPICGGASTLLAKLNHRDRKRRVIQNRLPIWAFHGAKDDGVPVQESRRMVKLLRDGGNKSVKLTVYPDAGHDSWTATYHNPELYRWFLRHSRK